MSNPYYRGYRGRYRGKKKTRNDTPVCNAPKKNEDNNSSEDESNSSSNRNQSKSVGVSWDMEDIDLFDKNRDPDVPYVGWKLHFHDEVYKKDSPLVKKIKIFEEFMSRHKDLLTQTNLQRFSPFSIDIKHLKEDKELLAQWPDFMNDLQNEPKTTLNCFGLAIHQTIFSESDENRSPDVVNRMIRVKILNYLPIVPLKDLKILYYGKLITTRGCIIRVGRFRRVAQWIVFSCVNCKLQRLEKQPDGIYTLPKKCDICGTKKFNPVLNSPYVKTVPFQVIKLQEHFGDDQDDRGRMPRTLDIELIGDLVNTCMPGNDVTITGIIKMQKAENVKGKANPSNPFSLYMEAISVTNNKSSSENSNVNEELKILDLMAIKEVHNDPDIFKLLVRSLCPAIYGHEMEKAGLLLTLFGGSPKHENLRDDIHILLIGDPGLGKSQMLRACARVAPKGIFVSGNSSSSSGLTVSLQREAGTNDFALEPGALVLADKGVCCIDEFDKMSGQQQALLEAMEQQCVSIAKSGVLWSLPARTSIIAAANPINGCYNILKTFSENINMSIPLLSRFDLIFLLLDRPNEHVDNYVVSHVMNLHTGGKKARSNVENVPNEAGTSFQASQRSTLGERLSSTVQESEKLIPHSILRKYIVYARQYVRPRLTESAGKILQNFYLEMKQNERLACEIPISARQLESLIRLTEARAKVELREECTVQDAIDVVELMKNTIRDTAVKIPLPITDSKSGKLTKNKVNAFLELIKQEYLRTKKKLFTTTELYEITMANNFHVDDMSSLILKLNDNGIFLKKGSDLYQYVP